MISCFKQSNGFYQLIEPEGFVIHSTIAPTTKIEAHENPAITMNIQNNFSGTEPTNMDIINY